jgi:hypothetical protein
MTIELLHYTGVSNLFIYRAVVEVQNFSSWPNSTGSRCPGFKNRPNRSGFQQNWSGTVIFDWLFQFIDWFLSILKTGTVFPFLNNWP